MNPRRWALDPGVVVGVGGRTLLPGYVLEHGPQGGF